MANFKCTDGIYTVLRNGLVLKSSGTVSEAIQAIGADAIKHVCPPECCITEVEVALVDAFNVTVESANYAPGLSARITITSGVDTYSTDWQTVADTNTFDLVGLIVEVGGWFDGDTVCVEYSYDRVTAFEGCCMTVVTNDYAENDTYQLSEIVTECDGGTFELLYQNPDGGVTIDPDGEMVVPDIEDAETVFATYTCDGCVTELLVLSVAADLGLRLTFDSIGNVPVADASNVGQWNTFFNLPANGTAFTSVSVTGAEVKLIGGSGITLKAELFRNNANIVKIEDDADCVVAVAGGKNLGAVSLCPALTTVTLNGVTTVAQEGLYANAALTTLNMDALTTAGIGAFQSCTSMIVFNLPALTTVENNCFSGNTSATTYTLPSLTTAGNNLFNNCTNLTTVTMASCTDLGGTTGDDSVFLGCNALTSVSVPTALATVNGGNPDGDLVYANGTLGATINYL